MKKQLIIGGVTILNMGILFLQQWYILVNIGPGMQTDALVASMTLPQILLIVLSGSFSQVLVPLLTGEKKEIIKNNAWSLIVIYLIIFGILAIVLSLTAAWWLEIIFPGFKQEGGLLVLKLTKIQLLWLVLAAVNGVVTSACYAEKKFVIPDVLSVCTGLVSLICISLTLIEYGVESAAWISNIRLVVLNGILLYVIGLPKKINLKSELLKGVFIRSKPLVIGAAYYKTDIMIDRYLLSTANSGTLTSYHFAMQIYTTIMQVFDKAIATPMTWTLSKCYKDGNIKKFNDELKSRIISTGVLIIAPILMIMLFGKNIIEISFDNKMWGLAEKTNLLVIILLLSGVLVGGVLGQLSSKSFYIKGDTARLANISGVTYSIFSIIKIISYNYWSVTGLAISSSIYYLTNFIVQWIVIRKGKNENSK